MIDFLAVPPIVVKTQEDSVGTITYTTEASDVYLVDGQGFTLGAAIEGQGVVVNQMQGVLATDIFDVTDYARRDRELMGRDVVNVSATVRLASHMATVWNCVVRWPKMPCPAMSSMINDAADRPVSVSIDGTVTHVNTTSVPFDGVTADTHLYARDLVIYETLARTASIFVEPPLESIDPNREVVGVIGTGWSVASAERSSKTASPGETLDVALIRTPDQNLAHRDNTVGVFAARLNQLSKNPFKFAERLLVRTTGSFESEAEVYVHDESLDTSTTRVWVAEPRLENRLQLEYDTELQTLRMAPMASGQIHIPQPQPYSSGGTEIDGVDGTTIEIVPGIPQRHDSEFWRQKVANIPFSVNRASLISTFSGAYVAAIDYAGAVDNLWLPRLGQMTVDVPCTVPAGQAILGLLINPSSYLEIHGCTMTGLTHDGQAGGLFPMVGGLASYTTNLDAGNYQLEIEYSNHEGDVPTDFPVTITMGSTVISTSPLRFGVDGLENGDWATATYNIRSVGTQESIDISWQPDDAASRLKIRKIRIISGKNDPVRLVLEAEMYESNGTLIGTARSELNGHRQRPDTILFKFDVAAQTLDPSWVVRITRNESVMAIAVNQVQIAAIVVSQPTPNSAGFESLPHRYADRAFKAVADSFNNIAEADWTDPRIAIDETTYEWTSASTESWMQQIEVQEPRIRQAFRVSGPVDVGHPVLLPKGLVRQADGTVLAKELPENTRPIMATLQPWMVPLRLWVAHEDFWS